MSSEERASFSSKIGMLLATAGSAVGLGNVWRFPYMAGENGGAAFILVYIGCVVLLGVPCMISEFIIGRESGSNAARAYKKLSPNKFFGIIGYLGVLAAFLITGYYAVVSGWCVEYIVASAVNKLHGSPDFFKTFFDDFAGGAGRAVMWTVIVLLITHVVIVKGVREGIEKASKFMMPALFILLIIMVVLTCMLPGAGKGVEYLLYPDFSKITPKVFIDALGQSFYSLSLAMGILCTYASYYVKKVKLPKTAYQIGFIDMLVAILAGLIIFPAAFSVGVEPDSGPSLLFVTLPNVFQNAFANYPVIGYIVSISFYALLTLAALTSLISLHEVSTVFLAEEMHISRKWGATAVTISCIIIGSLCSLSFGGREWLQIGGQSLFGFLDFITGQVMLPIGGLLSCILVGWFLPKKMISNQYNNWGTYKTHLFNWYLFCTKFLCPVLIILIFLHQFGIV